jgi:hypothetical protein
MTLERVVSASLVGILILGLMASMENSAQTNSAPVDPGVRGGPPGAGGPLPGLTADETAFFQDGQSRFAETEVVQADRTTASGHASTQTSCPYQ